MYPKELYRNNHYRVVWGVEEHAQFAKQGWKDEMDRPRDQYVVHHSGEPEVETEAPEVSAPRKGGRKKAEPEVETDSDN